MLSFILGPINFHTSRDGFVFLAPVALPASWAKGRLDAPPPAPANGTSFPVERA